MNPLTCFFANDIRGKVGSELTASLAYHIGACFAQFLRPQSVVIGGDARLSTPPLKQALVAALLDAQVDVMDIGLVGTEEVYFAVMSLGVDGGVMITASHNPIEYNGMKLVGAGARPIASGSGLPEIKGLVEARLAMQQPPVQAGDRQRGHYRQVSVLEDYVTKLFSFVDLTQLKPLRLVVNAGHGTAGHVIDAIERRCRHQRIPLVFIKIQHQADGHFPCGIPNPQQPERRAATQEAIISHGADMGIAWDGDFDRCFLFDETGCFIEGYYIVGLLADVFLQHAPGARIVHDPRLIWNTQAIVQQAGGTAVMAKTGHAFVKEQMRQADAIYGGELSAHHYFRDFGYCDSGMVPWLLVAELLSIHNCPLSDLVAQRIRAFPASGEINLKGVCIDEAIAKVQAAYGSRASQVDRQDGISMSFTDDNAHWRFNLRGSNTEPLVRLNLETRADAELLAAKTDELLALLRA